MQQVNSYPLSSSAVTALSSGTCIQSPRGLSFIRSAVRMTIPINGYLHVKSSLAQALAHAEPGDEFTYTGAGKDRPALYVSL
jgi:hypothetical protein